MPRLAAFTQAHPEVESHRSNGFRMIAAAKRLPRSPVDVIDTDSGTSIAVRFGYGRYKDCRVNRIFAADYCPRCGPSLLRSKRPLPVPRDLRWHVLLHDETIPDDAIRPTWEKWLRVAGVTGVKPHHGPRFRDVALALEAARDGQALALAKQLVARNEIEAGRFVIPPAPPLHAHLAFHLVAPLAGAEQSAVVAFRERVPGTATREPTRPAASEAATS